MSSADRPRSGWRVASAYGSTGWRVTFALVIVLSLVILFAPESAVPNGPKGIDKVVHVTLFATLCGAGYLAGVRARWLVPALAVYAAASEVIQASPVLGRSASGWDVLADAAGIALGLAAAHRTKGRP